MLAWIGWKKVCSSTNNGGLGIGSLQASNLAMLAKWRWRFHLDLDEHALWKRVIKSTYGIGGGLDISSTSYTLQPSPWKLFSLESTRDCKIMDRCYLDNESTDLKWDWRRPIRDGPERVQFDGLNNLLLHFVPSSSPDSWEFGLNESRCFTVSAMRKHFESPIRDGPERVQFDGLNNLLLHFVPSSSLDSWEFGLNESRCFTVSTMRKHFESFTLSTYVEKIRWNNLIPIKLNILTWRISLDRIPTRSNLDSRGIDLDSILCPVCNDEIKTSQHLLIDCSIVKSFWILVSKWWGFHDYPKDLPSLIK
nr:RNA-directed DNA polymerase, eukaryota, reverse transcriptase zinc-binding domain protein [Tanacetum cinerariifolium]